jgi:hypothetical protein
MHPRTLRPDDGTSTSEYAVGTVGACTIALVLQAVAADGGWIYELVRGALAWRSLLDGFPVPNLRLR